MAHNCNPNGPKDSKPDDDSDTISPLSGHINSVNKNDDGSNADSGWSDFEDGDVPTPVPNDEIENAKKIAVFVRTVLRNEKIPDDKIPSCILFDSEQSVQIFKEDLKNIILNKSAKVMANHAKSHIAIEMRRKTTAIQQQRFYYKKYRELYKRVKATKSKLGRLVRTPKSEVRHVRNVGTYVNMPNTL